MGFAAYISRAGNGPRIPPRTRFTCRSVDVAEGVLERIPPDSPSGAQTPWRMVLPGPGMAIPARLPCYTPAGASGTTAPVRLRSTPESRVPSRFYP